MNELDALKSIIKAHKTAYFSDIDVKTKVDYSRQLVRILESTGDDAISKLTKRRLSYCIKISKDRYNLNLTKRLLPFLKNFDENGEFLKDKKAA